MVGASGMIIYWSRFIFSNDGSFQQQLSAANGGEGIKLIRNQAKISIANPTDNGFINVSGWSVTNVYAYGTTALLQRKLERIIIWKNIKSIFKRI